MEKEDNKQKRRQYADRGTRSGRLMSFRVDNDVARILAGVNNKGRLLNDLVKSWARGVAYLGKETPPKDDDLADYF